jgi:hypothetical protein
LWKLNFDGQPFRGSGQFRTLFPSIIDAYRVTSDQWQICTYVSHPNKVDLEGSKGRTRVDTDKPVKEKEVKAASGLDEYKAYIEAPEDYPDAVLEDTDELLGK